MNAMQPPQSIEEIKAGLETTEKGGVRQSIRNCLTVFQRDPLLSGAIAYNILTDRKDIIKPIGFHRESTALNDTDMKYLLLYLEETYGLTNEKKIDNAIGIVANENKYHPIRDYLNTLVWDGTERIRFCLRHFLGADTDDYTYEALKLFLMGAISRAFQPGCKFEIMLCLVGGQGAGKSTFFRLLAVRDEWFSDDLRKLDDDNVYRKLQGHWIIEMSEMMATANAKSIEEIKSFLSRQKEVYKIPYETHPADRPRQCVFGGTSNALDFLPLDRSGNRRFIPVMVYPEQAEGVLIKIRLYHSGFGVLRHKIPLVFFEIPLHGGAESQLEPAASVNLHSFCPHLLDIGSGSSFILQNVNLGLLRVHHDGDKAAIAGTVKGKKIKSIGSAAKHALTRAVCRVGFIGYLVNLFLPA